MPAIGPLLLAAHAVLEDYLTIGLADAMNVVLARDFRTDVIATLDHRHFRAIRPLAPQSAFRLLPALTQLYTLELRRSAPHPEN